MCKSNDIILFTRNPRPQGSKDGQETQQLYIILCAANRVVDKSRQPAKYAGFSARFSPATFIASRARTEMMFIRSKLGLNKNINLHCLCFLKT